MSERRSLGQTARPRWIVIVPQIPRPDRAAGDRRLMALLEALAPRCTLTIVALSSRPGDAERYESQLARLGIELGGYGGRAAIRLLVARAFDAVFLEFYHVAAAVQHFVAALQSHALVVVDSVDLHYLREREAARLNPASDHHPAATEAAELAVYRRADITVVLTESERQELHQRGITDVVIVPILVPQVPRIARDREDRVLFVGGFRHPPNAAAVEWFASDIWPLIRKARPVARWTIVGSDAPPAVVALDGHDGIHVAGYVESTEPYLDDAQVSVAPLTYGAGMKGKVGEALAAGVPVVTTAWGAQGLERGAGTAFLLADTASEFAHSVIHVLTDPALRASLSAEGPRLAQQLCSTDTLAPVLDTLVSRSVSARRGSTLAGRMARFMVLIVSRRAARIFRSRQ
jgi:O-antigen biosynthesis protein